ncbi:hypothetical protein L7F22_066834 [Adiantum nelumboides]|nr:hypothetical protein [Adiantum nelumboides]
MGLAAFYASKKAQNECNEIFNHLISKGCTHIDTADIYSSRPSNGEGEEQIGAFFASNPGAREKVFLATKHTFLITPNGMELKAGVEYCAEALEASLKRLQTDHVDLYYCHRAVEPVEEQAKGLKNAKDAGKTRYVGVSEYSVDQLERFEKICHIDALQIELSPWTPEVISNGVLDWCKKNGTALIAYSPVGRGFLTGAIKSPDDLADDDFRKNNERFQGDNFTKNLELVADIKKIADKKGATPAQIALAWVLAQGDNVHPIPGSTKIRNIDENLGASNVKLSKSDLDEINGVINSFKVAGDRYSGPMKDIVHF